MHSNKSHCRIVHSGFTIVELLIVIVVIGILAAITLVAFNGIQARAKVSNKGTDINSLLKQFETKRLLADSDIVLSSQYSDHAQSLATLELGNLADLIIVGNNLPDENESCRIDPQTGNQTPMTKDHFCVEVLGLEDIRIIWWNDVQKS